MADNAKMILHEHVAAAVVDGRRTPGETRRIGVRDLGVPLEELIRRPRWKDQIATTLRAEGWSVHAISAIPRGPDGAAVVAYVERTDPTVAPQRRRPVTRGGRPIAGPDLSRPTMAARQRRGR